MRVIISAGGTGGHIYPALAIINKIKEHNNDAEFLYIGTTTRMEKDIIPEHNIKYIGLDTYGLQRKLTLKNFKVIFKYFSAIKKSKKIIKEFNPDIVIGTGGYICGATISAAHNLDIPTMLHESNAFPGKAVKMLANKTDTILVSFKDAEDRIKNAKNIVYSGTPVKIVKKEYGINEKSKIIKDAGLTETKPIVLIFGGSQGAQKINEAILGILKNKANKKYQIMWATGPKQYDIIKEELQDINININNIENAKIVPYIYNMEEIMNVSNLIVARSGAMTITEISNLGKPSILIPLPNVSGNHQLYNAKVLENVGAAKIILNNELTDENLNENIESIILNKTQENQMAKNALKVSNTDAEDTIYNEIVKLVK